MQDPPIRSRLFAATRYLVVIGVAGSFVAASALMIYGGIEVVMLVVDAVREVKVSGKGAKALALAFIEVVDLFLLATVFYIIALGLYELFINPTLALPEWLVIRDLDDLKNKLTGVVIVVMAVLFLGQVVTWDGERDLLRFGAGIALVVAALSYFLSLKTGKEKTRD